LPNTRLIDQCLYGYNACEQQTYHGLAHPNPSSALTIIRRH